MSEWKTWNNKPTQRRFQTLDTLFFSHFQHLDNSMVLLYLWTDCEPAVHVLTPVTICCFVFPLASRCHTSPSYLVFFLTVQTLSLTPCWPPQPERGPPMLFSFYLALPEVAVIVILVVFWVSHTAQLVLCVVPLCWPLWHDVSLQTLC